MIGSTRTQAVAAARGFGVPAVCITLSRDSNPCQLATAVPVVSSPAAKPARRGLPPTPGGGLGHCRHPAPELHQHVKDQSGNSGKLAVRHQFRSRGSTPTPTFKVLCQTSGAGDRRAHALRARADAEKSDQASSLSASVNPAVANNCSTPRIHCPSQRTILAYQTIDNNLNSAVSKSLLS